MTDILISASIGIEKNADGSYSLHVICDREDYGGKRNDYWIPLSQKEAKRMAKKENLEISEGW